MNDHLWARSSAESLNARARQGAVALLPVASTEQHGPHLATGVDTILCGEVCRRAAERASVPVVVAPTLWMGLAEHHMAFGGSFTLPLDTYRLLLEGLCRSIERAGFRRIVICNGHGGNMTALNAISAGLAEALTSTLAVTTYWTLDPAAFRAVLEDQQNVLHACEAETSMMMRVAPDLVDAARLGEAVGGNLRADAVSTLSPAFHVWRSFRDMTRSGVLGDARKASAEKGEALLEAAANALARSIEGFAEA